MNKESSGISSGKAAVIAAIGLLIMAIAAPIANFVILNDLVVPDNAAKTFDNITASEGAFRIAICLFFLVAVLDVIVAWALFIFLKPVSQTLSTLAAWFRIIYATILLAALFYLLQVLLLLNRADISSFETDQLHMNVLFSVNSFSLAWESGLIIFGFHLFLIGYLMVRAGYMKKILGILLIIASLGYLTDGFGEFLSAGYDLNIAVYTFFGEVVLIFWLLISGRKHKETV